jgi:hypothetical protein
MVEIFKTNVNNKRLAAKMLKELSASFPCCCFNFDLDDCDRILRVQSDGSPIYIDKIIQMLEVHLITVCVFEE